MHVSLTPELEARIKAKVDSGLYNNASEVVREALRFVETHEEWINELKLARLREQLQEGILQLNQGQGIHIDSKAGKARPELSPKLIQRFRYQPYHFLSNSPSRVASHSNSSRQTGRYATSLSNH